jgi:hypothetical protein
MKRNARAIRPRPLPTVATAAEPFAGTVWPPAEKRPAGAGPLATEATESSAPADEPGPKLAADAAPENVAPAVTTAPAEDVETKSVGKIKRVFGTLLRPFRGGPRKEARKAETPGGGQ